MIKRPSWCPLSDLSSGYVIGATPFATRTSRLHGVEFDTVLFDEASQITLPLAIMGMLTARRAIFFGDHEQLPPVLTTRMGSAALRESVFAHLSGHSFDTMLTETYRLNAALVAWPSATFYGGALRPANEAVAARCMVYDPPPAHLETLLDPAEPLVFVDLRHRNTTTRSRTEAILVADLVAALLTSGVPPDEIGVVVPYRAQRREIRSQLGVAVPDAASRQS